MPKKKGSIGFFVEMAIPYLLVGVVAYLHYLGHIKLPDSSPDRLTALSAAISVGSILFGFSGVILVTISTISSSRVIRDLRKNGGLTKLFYTMIESVVIDFLFVSSCIAGIFGFINIHLYQTFWLFLFGLSVLKFFYSIIVLFLLIQCQVDDVVPSEQLAVPVAKGVISPEDFNPEP